MADRYKAVGLCTGHAFSLIKVVVAPGGHRLCMIRNPWGNGTEWTGNWSDESPLWTAEIQAAVGFSKADDGTFWMCWEDVVEWFDSGSVTYVMPTWSQCRVAGNFDAGIPDIVIQLDVHMPTALWLGAHQRDTRGVQPGHQDAKYAGLQLAVVQANDRGTSTVIAANPSFLITRDVFLEVELQPSPAPYFVILQAYQDLPKSFVLSLFAENTFGFKASFVAYGEGTEAKYNPISACRPGLLTTKVAGQYQVVTSRSPLPVERSGNSVDFDGAKDAAVAAVANKRAGGGGAVHNDPNSSASTPPPSQIRKAKTKTLTITVVSGSDLVAKDDNGLSDPYVTLTLCDAAGKRYVDFEELSTAYLNETLNPVWGESFTMEVHPTDVVVAEVWDKDLFGRDAMGSCRIPLSQVTGLASGGAAVMFKQPLKGGDATGHIQFMLKLH
jgi:hypothetical protein